MFKIIIFGNASNKIINEFIVCEKELNSNCLDWLRSKHIPIASSCNGDGVCRKCLINTDQLACEILLRNFFHDQNKEFIINISYL